jgi:hypothetical protein
VGPSPHAAKTQSAASANRPAWRWRSGARGMEAISSC